MIGFRHFRIKAKLIFSMVLILITVIPLLSLMFIKNSERLLIESLEEYAELLNRNFSIVSAKAIEESSFSNLQSLINEVAAADKNIKVLVIAYPNGMIIATSDTVNFRQFSKIENEYVVRQLEKKEDKFFRDKHRSRVESIRFIYRKQDILNDEKDKTESKKNASSGKISAGTTGELAGVIYIVLDTAPLENSIATLWHYSILIMLGLMGAGIAAAYWFGSSMSKPIKALAEQVRIIASGNWEQSVESESRDEVGQLVSDVDKMRLAIKELTENLKEQERLKNEMELARRIQTSLLPTLADNFHPDFQIAAAMIPADQVGGDFYDISYDRKGNLWLAVGDVSGHGVTPGLIMMMAQTIHTTVTASMDCDARGVVITINKILYKNIHERLNESHFMTFTALKYLGSGRFQHAGAHLSMIVFHHKTGECELIRTNGVYLNFKADISRATKNAEFYLDYGDIIVLYTDGLTEAETPDGKMLDIGGFMKLVAKYAHRNPEDMKDMIMADVIQWCDNKRGDDMSIVVIKRKKERDE